MELIHTLFAITVIMFSAVVHEVMHGMAADKLGDPTARYAGRLTLNPIQHLDAIGSVILPLFLALSQSPFLFGWAKPVPYNPYNLFRAPRWGEAVVAFAGPASNFTIAILMGLVIRLGFLESLNPILSVVVTVNVMLGIFNLIPIPPLDGSKILPRLLPPGLSEGYENFRRQLEYNPFVGMVFVLLFIALFGAQFSSLVSIVANVFAGHL